MVDSHTATKRRAAPRWAITRGSSGPLTMSDATTGYSVLTSPHIFHAATSRLLDDRELVAVCISQLVALSVPRTTNDISAPFASRTLASNVCLLVQKL